MTQLSTRNFGLLIAYVLPGVVVLFGMTDHSETVRSWFGVSARNAPTIGGFLYVTLASVAAGMIVSAARWLVVDWLHHRTGIQEPDWDFSALQANHRAFQAMVESHYRYYQFYANMLVALTIAAIAQWPLVLTLSAKSAIFSVVAVSLAALLHVASRDALRKYYAHTTAFLGSVQQERRLAMTNGSGPDKKHVHKKTAARRPRVKSPDGNRSRKPTKTSTAPRQQ